MKNDRLRVKFDDPGEGWIGMTIQSDGISPFNQSFSYTPYDSFFELITAVAMVSKGDGEWVAHWNAEPIEYEFQLQRTQDEVHLRIQRHADNQRQKGQEEAVFTASGDFSGIALPFWRALQNLRSRFSVEELDRRWHRKFPVAELDRLTTSLKK